MSSSNVPNLDAQVEALAVSFMALAKFLGRSGAIATTQIPNVLKDAAKDAKVSPDTMAAVIEIGRRISP